MFVLEVKPSIIRNSRREKSIQIILKTYEGRFVASAPSGKSKGKHEVPCYNEKGLTHSIRMIKVFSKQLIGKNFIMKKVDDLRQVTDLIEIFEHKFGHLGGNITYALETAFLKAAAADKKKWLYELINDDINEGLKPKMPMPVGNCIGGGLHTNPVKGKRPDFQEFLLIPNEKKFSRAVTKNIRAYERASKLIREMKVSAFSGKRRNDEGAWRTRLSNEAVLDVLKKVAKKYDLRIGLDVAASTFCERGYYKYKNKDLIRDRVDQMDYMAQLVKKYGIFYVEDPMDEEDFAGFKQVLNSVHEIRKTTLIVGDDLTVTNPDITKRAVRENCINAMIIKPNQVGSILKVKEVVNYCKKHNIKTIFSHRSGETMDDALADYAVGFGADFMKSGIYGPERLIKLKRVMDIERKVNR